MLSDIAVLIVTLIVMLFINAERRSKSIED